MKTTQNLFNFVDMLKLSNNEINNITAQDFTLDELVDFADFLAMLGEHFRIKTLKEQYKDFVYWVNHYNRTCECMTLEEVETSEWLDEQFLELKIKVEDMATALVLDSGNPFFSEVHR